MSINLGLQSETPLDKDQLKNVNQVIHYIWESNDSVEFRQPVDWKALQLFDYNQIIKNPMDLGTVKRKLQIDKYKTVESVLEDIQLIWDNCKVYNLEGSFIWKLADKLEKLMRRAIKNFLPNVIMKLPVSKPSQQPSQEVVQDLEELSYQARVSLANSFRQLQQEQVSLLVAIIKSESPLAFIDVNGQQARQRGRSGIQKKKEEFSGKKKYLEGN